MTRRGRRAAGFGAVVLAATVMPAPAGAQPCDADHTITWPDPDPVWQICWTSPERGASDLPFPADLDEPRAERLAELLGHYAFRLFFRGALGCPAPFDPSAATRYVGGPQCRRMAGALVRLGLAERASGGGYRLVRPARNFGGTLEWYVSRELRRRLGFDVASGLKFRARGVGGDLDVVAAAEGKLVYLELKSSPPRHLTAAEVAAFFDRLDALRPHLALFVIDTALRLTDKVVPMLAAERSRRGAPAGDPRRMGRGLWSLSPALFAVGANPDLIGNLGRAIAAGFRGPAPPT